ncbi:MAG: response regulator [Ferruginibacter sp.]|nr:response regulator [Cytophagales bacterium]
MKKIAVSANPVPDNEALRLEALRRYQILDTPPEADFDDLVQLASQICQTPITLLTLIDADRQWFKSKLGTELSEAPRDLSFCQYAILGNDVYEVPDTTASELFADNPLVTGDPNIRFYAGTPLTNSGGFNLGTLCVFDIVPRTLTDVQRNSLRAIARQVVTQLELRLQWTKLAEDNVHLTNYQTFEVNTTEIMCIVNARTFLIEEVNEAFTRILGYAKEEVCGQLITHYFYPEDLADLVEIVERGVREGEEVYEYEKRILCQDSSFRWLSWNAIAKGGKWFANARDITKRRETEEKLTENKQMLVESQAIAHVGSWEINMDTQELTWSDETFRLCGLQPGSPTPSFGKYLRMLHPDDVPVLVETVQRAIEDGQPRGLEFRILLPDGSVRHLLGKSRPKFEEGKSGKLIGTLLDITERKLAEIELTKAKDQAEKSMKSKEQFLSTMSHEIRTPMNAVIGMTYLLLQENPRPDQTEYLKTLRFSAENLLVLINDILDFSKIEAGKVTFESVNFNLKELISGIRQSLMYKAEEKGIRLKVRLDADLPEVLSGDPVRLNQILTNLVSNAVKFTHQGSVEINVTLRSQSKEAALLDFQVTDTGIGILPEELANIFESFTQASSDTTRKYGGTGLGLAITKRLLELQNSRIEVQSQAGQGSKFFFTISFSKGTTELPGRGNAAVALPTLDPLGLQHVHLLLVEDNEVNQLVATKFLSKWGARIEYAVNGLVALEKIKTKQYDVVLMDLQMPGMDGYEATRAIRAMEDLYFQQVPIIALTASAMLEVRDQVYVVGMNDYISKPFNPNELYGKIVKHAGKDELAKPDRPTGPFVETSVETLVGISFERFFETAADDLDFARELTRLGIEALAEYQREYGVALLERDLAKLQSVNHKMRSIVQLLELKQIRLEAQHGESLLGNGTAEESALVQSSARVTSLCETAALALENNLGTLVPK